MIEETLSLQQAQIFYDRIGHRYDWFEMYEGKAKMCCLESLQLQPGLRVSKTQCCSLTRAMYQRWQRAWSEFTQLTCSI